jgi:hypothetical protein
MLFAGSESVKHCGAIAVRHLLQRPFHEANDRNTKNGSPVKNGGLWSIWDDHLVSSGYLRRVTIFSAAFTKSLPLQIRATATVCPYYIFWFFSEDFPTSTW